VQYLDAMKLSELPRGRTARVSAIDGTSAELEAKLREVGFSEGDEVEMLTHGPFHGRTLAVRLNRSIIALRGTEAALITVEPR
jgi:ferrous iron transport protein A